MITWLVICLLIALAMFIAELFIPSGGLLAIIGAVSITSAILICFAINRWLGAALLLATIVIAPFAMSGAIKLWQRTPIGRRMILTTTVGELPRPHLLVGSTGMTLTEMRPMGEIEVAEIRVEALSEMAAIIPAGRKVKVLSISGNVATVREMKETV